MSTRIVFLTVMALFIPVFLSAQLAGKEQKLPLIQRVKAAPKSVFTMFRDAGMNPVNHPLTAVEKEKVKKAIAILPPLHQQILKQHLQSISFMDSMPNNALTSLISDDTTKLFNITFRAGILQETISEWATKKEYTSFNVADEQGWSIMVEAGQLDALQYVFLHEATHVIDAVLNITPHANSSGTSPASTPFTQNIWLKQNQPVARFTDSLLNKARLRNRSVPVASAATAYQALNNTPFASLYSMAAWSEDIAELITIYHVTQKLHQPYRVVIRQNQAVIAQYEPIKNELVKKRLEQLNVFYKGRGEK